MIPRSVRMNGWMRYRDEQVADFGDGRLIAICGANGAGKSSIFDAITFALYGQHRLGRQHADQLISEGMDRLSVEFEFEAEHEGRMARFLVRRSRGAKQGERDQGLWIWDDGADGGKGDFTQVPGTEKEEALDRAITRIVRLSAAAFTSSFMLRQGEATEFIDADPKPRFEIISGLIGLEQYKELEARAAAARLAESKRVKELKAKLDEYAGIDEAARADLQAAVTAADADAATASVELQAARACVDDAKRYALRVGEVASLDARIVEAEVLIAGAPQIESDAQLHETLSGAAETVKRIRATLADATREEAAMRAAQAQAAAIDLAAIDASASAAASAAVAAHDAAGTAEQDHGAANDAERGAYTFLGVAKTIIDGRASIARHDGDIAVYEQRLAAQPELQTQYELAGRVHAALPALRAVVEARKHLEDLRRAAAGETAAALEAQHATLVSDAAATDKEIASAEQALAEARTTAAGAVAQAATLDAQLAGRRAAASEATCSRCGQPVDRKRAAAEVKELTAALADAKRGADAAAKAESACDAALAARRKTRQQQAAAIAALAPKMAAAASREQDLMRAEEGLRGREDELAACAPEELLAPLRAGATAAAAAGVLKQHAPATKRADALRKQIEELHGIAGQHTNALAERERLRATLATHEGRLDGRLKDVPDAERAHLAAKQRLSASEQELTRARAAAKAAAAAEGSARDAATDARAAIARIGAEIAGREAAAAGHRTTAEAFAAGLGEVIGPKALADAEGTLRTLDDHLAELRDAPARLAALQQARTSSVGWAGERSAKRAEIEGIPEPHRIDEGAARASLAASEAAATSAHDAHARLLAALAQMDLRLEDVVATKEQKAAAELRWKRLKMLVKLLGKEGLQGALVTDALGQITSHANAFLQRLTGGNLILSIHQEGDALELQALDATCMTKPHAIKLLSGSQKFRCAVAIASGIGQYAGAGGMRSIVIDEGFASLDLESQQLMVDELKELSQHMDRVIVVSHLEAFSNHDDFPDQILVEAAGDRSRIRRTYGDRV